MLNDRIKARFYRTLRMSKERNPQATLLNLALGFLYYHQFHILIC